MKSRLIITLLAIAVISCGLNILHVTIPSGIDGDEIEAVATQVEPRLRKLGQNPFFVYELTQFGDRLLGVGSGVKNDGRFLFGYNEDLHKWEPSAFWVQNDEDSVGKVNLESLSGMFALGSNLWLTTRSGSVIRRHTDVEIGNRVASFKHNVDHIFFVNSEVGYASGGLKTGCIVLKTTDGGTNWTKIYENEFSGSSFDLFVLDEKTILLAMNNEYILRSDDGGGTWEYRGLVNQYDSLTDTHWVKHDISGASAIAEYQGVVWVVGEKGSLFFSQDAGKSWTRPARVPASFDNQKLNSIDFSNAGRGVAVGDDGLILYTTDGGIRWSELTGSSIKGILSDIPARDTDDLIEVKFVGENAFVLGRDGTYEIMFEVLP